MASHSRADLEAEYVLLLKQYSERVLAQTGNPSAFYGENSAYRAATRELRIELQKKAAELQELSSSGLIGKSARRFAEGAGGH